MLHRSCDRAKVFDNYSYDNEDAGLALYESSECQVYDNNFYYNKRESNRPQPYIPVRKQRLLCCIQQQVVL